MGGSDLRNCSGVPLSTRVSDSSFPRMSEYPSIQIRNKLLIAPMCLKCFYSYINFELHLCAPSAFNIAYPLVTTENIHWFVAAAFIQNLFSTHRYGIDFSLEDRSVLSEVVVFSNFWAGAKYYYAILLDFRTIRKPAGICLCQYFFVEHLFFSVWKRGSEVCIDHWSKTHHIC